MSGLESRKALIDSLEAGDLIRLNGKLRVVRDAGRRIGRAGHVYSITLSIMRCSWTRRPYTVRGRSDLYHAGLEVVRKGYGCEHGPLDVLLQRDINGGGRLLECCDVIGVVS